MVVNSYRYLHPGALLFLATLMRTAGAWNQATTLPSALPTDFVPSSIAATSANGYWVAGTGPVLSRYDLAGTTQVIRYIQSTAQANYLAVAAEPDGGVAVSEMDSSLLGHCLLQRYDAAGNLRWANAALAPENANPCPFRIDGTGGAWVRTGVNTFNHLGFADGAVDATVSLDGVNINEFTGDPEGANVYVATGSAPFFDSSARAGISKLSTQGGVLWQWQAPQTAGQPTWLTSIGVDGSGNVLAFGSVGPDSTFAMYAVEVSAEGTTRWARSYPDFGAAGAAVVAAASSYVVVSPPGTQAIASSRIDLAKLSGDGTLIWTTPLATGTADNSCFASSLRATVTGDAIVAIGCSLNSDAEIARFSPNGIKTGSQLYPHSAVTDLQVLADASSLSIIHPNVVVLPSGGYQFPLPFLARSDAAGMPLAVPQLGHSIPALDAMSNAVFDRDGSAYLLSTNATMRQFTLDRVAADGTILWRRAGNGAWSQGTTTAIVLVGHSVCLAGMLDSDVVVACFATEDGQPGATARLAQGQDPVDLRLVARPLGADKVELVYVLNSFATNSQTTHLSVTDLSGGIISDQTPLIPGENLAGASIDASGDVLMLTGPAAYIRFASDGTRRYSKTFNVTGATLLQALLTDEGTALLLYSENGPHLARLDTTGMPSWTRVLPAPSGAPFAYDYVPSLISAANDVVLALSYSYRGYRVAIGQAFPAFIARVGLGDGALRWSTTIPGVLFNYPKLAIDAASTRVLALSGFPNKIREPVLDAETGNVLADRFDECDADSCVVYNSQVAADGVLHVAADISSVTSGSVRRVFARQQAFATPSSVRIDQAGLDGAWFATYSGGQGFTFDYIASASTIFMPWFTFARNSSNDPSDLAWYVLQGGGIAPGATSAEVAISLSSPGVFNSGSVAGRQVGSAHLSFGDCNSGTLLYQFDADTNHGAGGLITLTRLTPGTDACTLADGSTAPPQIANAPGNGFDARQSGSWFDPATGGQGVEMTIIPSGNNSAGLVFIPWFTYDPAGHADDALNQHWFTLQGDLASAANGKVTLPIYRIIGGTFDAMPTSNFTQVGHAILTMSGCDTAELEYKFDISEAAHAFSGLSGTAHLVKIGGCVAH